MLMDLRQQADIPQLDLLVKSIGEPAFRARQLHEWIWHKQADSFPDMKNLGKKLITHLEENYTLNKIKIHQEQRSADGTVKFGFELFDGNIVEGVLIPTDSRMTACISSQVGCSLTCKFCATGYMDLKRNLQFYEIYDQVEFIRRKAMEYYQAPLTNIVYMGMGEPLLNYRQVMQSIEKVTTAEGMGMSPKRITVSSAGIAKMIRKLGDEEVKFEFALSLHAANDAKRSEIMPINEQNSLAVLKESLQHFIAKTGTRVTLEYILFQDFNDGLEDAAELFLFCQGVPCKINIIEYNPVSFSPFVNTSGNRMYRFKEYLEERGMIVNVRRSRGRDVDAACGQLAIQNNSSE
jgi:23S rRNA (adenine2503-C2)-methyltransferase